MRIIFFLTLSLFVLSACSWVRVTPEGVPVRLLNSNQISTCTRLGTTTSTTSSRVLFVPRGSEKVQAELVDLARNEAGLMGGNAIVADSTVDSGRQHFIVYSCP
ncbi:MAG: DUF4156 domain-containing protein [Gammaproteobacteria bacterium]|nr:DUF4156 domain-containing protein [Pseudomonadales bacterium]MCP5346862.1 DUF4156 domain-containing protein [Pseudomonadales bacterium]